MTVKNVLFDYSEEFSPAFVLARGQSADWIGLAIEEAAIYCPSNALGKGGFSLSVRDLLIGDPAGLQEREGHHGRDLRLQRRVVGRGRALR